MIKSLNSASSQVWAGILVVLGIGCLVLACFAKPANVQTAILSAATGLIGAGSMAFQHQSASPVGTLPSPAVDPAPLTPTTPPAR